MTPSPAANVTLPLRIMPVHLHDEKRIEEIESAIARYNTFGKDVPLDWISELQLLQARRGFKTPPPNPMPAMTFHSFPPIPVTGPNNKFQTTVERVLNLLANIWKEKDRGYIDLSLMAAALALRDCFPDRSLAINVEAGDLLSEARRIVDMLTPSKDNQ